MHQRNQILAFDRLDHRATGAGQPLAALSDDPHDCGGVEPGRHDRLLHLEHRLKELGIQPQLFLGQLALGDVELGPHIPDLAAGLVPHRLPGAGAPADLTGSGDHPVLLISQRPALGQALPLGQNRGPVVGMDVLEKLLIPKILFRVSGEPLEGRVYELEPPVHVVGDHAFAHGGGHRLQLAADLRRCALDPAPAHALPREQHRQADQQHDRYAAGYDEADWNRNQWDHESCAGLESDFPEDTSPSEARSRTPADAGGKF